MAKKLKKLKRKILNSRFTTALLAWLVYWYLCLVYKTCKWEEKGLENLASLWTKKENALLLSWHSRILFLPDFWDRKAPTEALVSPHHDGRLIARVLQKIKVKTIDGSSNDNAKAAAVNIVRSLKQKNNIIIIPDGPRGPRMKLNPSAIYFAQKTGVPIVVGSASLKGGILIEKSWDQMLLPKPFCQGIKIVSKPIYIPKDLTEAEFEAYRLKVETLMIELQNEADDFCHIKRTLPETKVKAKRRKD